MRTYFILGVPLRVGLYAFTPRHPPVGMAVCGVTAAIPNAIFNDLVTLFADLGTMKPIFEPLGLTFF